MLVRCLRTMFFAAAATSASVASAIAAGPVSPSSMNVAPSLLVPVHGCHRNWAWGYVPQWHTEAKHRHVGSDCRPIGVGGGHPNQGGRGGGHPNHGGRGGGDWNDGGRGGGDWNDGGRGGGDWNDGGRGGGDWNDGGYDEPPHGWRRGQYGPSCIQVGPTWYCPPD
jgi:hypothetical protein